MPRQPNGSSSINLNKDGRYHTWVTVGVKPNGDLDREHISGQTATDVKNAVDELKARKGLTSTKERRGETAGDWFAFYLDNIVKPNLRPKTYAGYASIFNVHVIPHLGGYRLTGMRHLLEPDHLEKMYAHLRSPRGGNLKPSYVLQIHHVISRSLDVALRRGRASRNPCDLMDPPRGGGEHIESLKADEARAVVAVALEDRLAARWVLGFTNGHRQGEALGVRWSYLDLEAGTIRPAKQLQRQTWEHGCTDPRACARPHCEKRAKWTRHCGPGGCSRHKAKTGCPPACPPGCIDHARSCPQRFGGGLVEVETKSKTGKGKAQPIAPLLVELFRLRREAQIREFDALGKTWDPNGLAFTTLDGKPIDPKVDHGAWERLLVAAGVDDARLHAARHTAGTLMVGGGTDISIVQELLRHATINTTREYVDVAMELKREAIEKITKTLFDGDLSALLRAATAAGIAVGPSAEGVDISG